MRLQASLRVIVPLSAVFLSMPAMADWNEHFDVYDVKIPLMFQSPWEPWAMDPTVGEFFATDEQQHSGPQSLRIDTPDDAVLPFLGIDDGVWVFTAWMYVPLAMNEVQYFILLNTHPADPGSPNNWSLQLVLDGADGTISDLNSEASAPLVTGQWTDIVVRIDLEADVQTVHYLGEWLLTKSWTAGVAPGGALRVAALDLWADTSVQPVYWDDISIRRLVLGPCAEDIDGNGTVDILDLLAVLANWGSTGGPADVNQDGIVDILDLLAVLGAWGPCPESFCDFSDIRDSIDDAELDPPHIQRNYDAINRTVFLHNDIDYAMLFAAPLELVVPVMKERLLLMESCTGLPTDVSAMSLALDHVAATAGDFPLGQVVVSLPGELMEAKAAIDAVRNFGVGFPPYAMSPDDAGAKAAAIEHLLAEAASLHYGDLYNRTVQEVTPEELAAVSDGLITGVLDFEAMEDGVTFGLCSNDKCCRKDGGDPVGDRCDPEDDWCNLPPPSRAFCSIKSDDC